jgi:hypothetical protein
MKDLRHSQIQESWISPLPSSPESVASKTRLALLIAEMQPGDELRHFVSPRETRQKRRDREGYVVIRDGKVIASVVLGMN